MIRKLYPPPRAMFKYRDRLLEKNKHELKPFN